MLHRPHAPQAAITGNGVGAACGDYDVSLLVTDSFGATSVANSPGCGAELSTAQTGSFSVHNTPPLVTVPNVEILDGDDLTLLGRFADAGWADIDHTASWWLGDLPPDGIGADCSSACSEKTDASYGAVSDDAGCGGCPAKSDKTSDTNLGAIEGGATCPYSGSSSSLGSLGTKTGGTCTAGN